MDVPPPPHEVGRNLTGGRILKGSPPFLLESVEVCEVYMSLVGGP